jgi:hypothetical protein
MDGELDFIISKELRMDALVMSAFPGTGKTCFFNKDSGLRVLDSDSSKFARGGFPGNYVAHVKDHIDKVDIILVSSHAEVRDGLVQNGIRFVLVYPEEHLRDEYLQRYRDRGNTDGFIDLIHDNWAEWIRQLQAQVGCEHVVLESGQFLSDVVGLMLLYRKH